MKQGLVRIGTEEKERMEFGNLPNEKIGQIMLVKYRFPEVGLLGSFTKMLPSSPQDGDDRIQA